MGKVYGPPITFTAEAVDATPAPGAPATPAKAVPQITVKDHNLKTEPVSFTMTVAPYELVDTSGNQTSKLSLIELVCLVQGFTLPDNPNDLLSGAHPVGSADTSAAQGGDYTITIPNTRSVVPPGSIGVFQSILTLDD